MSLALVNRKAALLASWNKNELWRRARAVPSLDLRFADNKSLVDATTGQNLISFTRASSGTYVDSQGVIRTATTNLLLRSEEFNDVAWVKRGTCAVVANDAIAPNGTLTADKVTFAGSGNDIYYGSLNVAAGTTVSPSIYVKKITASGTFTLQSANGSPNGSWSVNLSLLSTSWERLTATHPAVTVNTAFTGSGNNFSGFQLFQSSGIATELHLWGAQVEQSSTVGEYIPTTSTINSAPRFDHNPTTGESLGLLVEESRTNSIRNNTMVGAVAGTPGTAPTNWTLYGSQNGLTQEIVGIGTENGIDYIDIKWSGTTSAAIASTTFIATDATSATVAATGQTWTSSVYIRLIAGSYTGFTLTNLGCEGFASNQAYVEGGYTSFSNSATSLINGRVAVSRTFGGAVAFVRQRFIVSIPISTAINITLRIGLPQLEQGAFATSVIPTSTATATRSADVASISGSNFGVSRTNLLVRSEEFGDASWIKTRTSITDNATIAPNGTLTADKLVEDTSVTNNHLVYRGALALPSSTYTFSCFVKSAERSEVVLRLDTGGGQRVVNFNLASGSVGSATLGMQGSIVAVGGGWYRCIAALTVADTITNAVLLLAASGTTSYTGDGASGLFLWGAQLETGTTATAYIPTPGVFVSRASSGTYIGGDGVLRSATTNLLLQSEDFSTIWGNVATTEVINATVAPNGTVSADEIIEDTATASHYINQSFTSVSGSIYTFSCYVKAANRAVCFLVANGPGTLHAVSVNLTTGVASSAVGSPSNIISTAVGNGWYRVSFTYTSGTTGAVGHEVRLSTDGLWANRSYTGNGTGSIYAWGAQLEQSSSVGEYIPTTSTVNSAARYDHSPVTLIGKGLLLEEARTNSIRNNTMIGAVAGTPGTLPTNWIYNTAGGLSTEVVGSGTESGIAYVDLRLFGTSTSTSAIQYDANTQIAAAQGQTWTISHYLKLMSGSVPSGTNIRSRLVYRSGAGSYLGEDNAVFIAASSSTPLAQARVSYTATPVNASTAFIVPGILFNWPASTVVDITLRIGMPQLEQGAYVTSVIPTFNTAATRAADVSTSSAVTVFSSPWYRQDEGTVFSSFSIPTASTIGGARVYNIRNSSSTTQIWLRLQGGTNRLYEVTDSSTQQAALSAGTFSAGIIYRGAVGVKSNDFGFSENGSSPTVDTSGTLGTVDRLGVGMDADGAAPLNGTIRRLTYWPQRLSNPTLQSITQ